MFPIANSDLSNNSGVYLGRNYFTGLPVYLDTFSKELTNPHILIIGETGAGKSVTIKTIEGRSTIIDIKSAILDIEGEYVEQINRLGGRVINIKQGIPSGINLFDIEEIGRASCRERV